MRYVRIFFLHFQYVFERRGISLVWFLTTLINPLILVLYWRGAMQSGDIQGWSLSAVSSYYFILIVVAAMLTSHIEEDVANEDIAEGQLVKYIIKPFSYYWYNFIREIPYRILQGIFGIVICMVFAIVAGKFFQITTEFPVIILSFIVFISAYLLSFTYKMVLGLLAFWVIDARGFYQLAQVIHIVLAGYLLPLDLMPQALGNIAKLLPFSYMIFYPVLIIQGKVSLISVIEVIGMQGIWIGFFAVLYQMLWVRGIKKFTGMGQ